MARKSKELEEIIEMFNEDERIDEDEIEKIDFEKEFILDLESRANLLTDKRQNENIIHSVESILLLVIFAVMANCNTFVQIYLFMCKHTDWLLKYIMFDSGLPSLSTIKRVIGMINPRELEEICIDSLKVFLKQNKEYYYKDINYTIKDMKPMDGKTANSSDRNSSKDGKITKTNAMSICSIKDDICEATEFIEDKTNEIPTGIELLKRVDIKDCIILFDAMSTQTKTIEYIASNNGYYVAPVKGNQSTLEEDIELYFQDKENYNKAKKESYYKTTEKAHGGPETREYIFTSDVNWIYKKSEWKDLKTIGMVTRTYIDKFGNKAKDTRYFISNIYSSETKLLATAIRKEWTIENGLHLYLDMVFNEDDNKCFLENSQKNLNIIRKFVLAILKRYKQKTKLSMNSIRFNISMDFENEIDIIINKTLSHNID